MHITDTTLTLRTRVENPDPFPVPDPAVHVPDLDLVGPVLDLDRGVRVQTDGRDQTQGSVRDLEHRENRDTHDPSQMTEKDQKNPRRKKHEKTVFNLCNGSDIRKLFISIA